ncbi:hypothetical protein GS399_05590 [Pedobacter sp. HMF7647]|uniref:Uncharacterized protein n=1 Tax=Hufsiella arboris TaxID=2695275 RepID=A0A7K1Y8N9_9SPHI|nr:hypothetical protein [Hufsiella arboris]MXV50439.1 hypothetical protein [Hufsiella arboris]
MADRINWSAFPNLRDFDRFNVVETTGTPGEITITMNTASAVTLWKSIKFINIHTGRILTEQQTQDANHGPVRIRISSADYPAHKFTIAKAKIFGIHTDMYDIFELVEKDGRSITLTWLTDGPDNVFSAIGSFFSDLVNGVIAAVTTVVRAVVTVIDAVVGFILNALAWVAGFIFSLPVIGRIIEGIVNIIGWLVSTIINAVLDIIFGLLSIIGIRPPEKLLRIVIIVQQDGFGVPVATAAEVQAQLDVMIELYKVRANIKVIPFRPFQFTTPFSSHAATAVEDFTVFENRPSTPQTLDVNCGAAAFGDDLLTTGSSFELKINNLFWGNARRLVGHGAPIYVFAVRSFIGGTSAGCSLALWSNYVTVQFNSGQPVTGMAHECGHACNLWAHTTSPPAFPSNLMRTGTPATLPATLEDGQVILMRAAHHCTFF